MEHGGQERSGNLRSSSTARARKFWSVKLDTVKDIEMKNTDARDEEESIQDGRKKETNQVEDRKLTVSENQTKNLEDMRNLCLENQQVLLEKLTKI